MPDDNILLRAKRRLEQVVSVSGRQLQFASLLHCYCRWSESGTDQLGNEIAKENFQSKPMRYSYANAQGCVFLKNEIKWHFGV
ncbi:hypothetical protein M514_05704 [Trichuris suis]|uniref:Uncharacterized protein n=1 Tax=Trichuris suis TaxID=68888 RepID=A0A085NAH5_9BILA|nr:hypothetical protein M513_05704 [Trichuris suis]KFD66471.1 hypothetical protein M514_05704 [Trichuris suis]